MLLIAAFDSICASTCCIISGNHTARAPVHR